MRRAGGFARLMRDNFDLTDFPEVQRQFEADLPQTRDSLRRDE